MDVKLGELPTWILMWDFTPKGMAGVLQKGYYWGNIAGISMVLAIYMLFNYCLSYKELKHERLCKYC
ncbi:unnamed protein product [Nyctereutes procyonoides]|uniref:ATP synthase F(0) complex subunit f, mitochondrial n=1 Tax=Nyctereutes procyonoides TaxID=34880 RepID=A0A811YAN5_NYCPR|nr:unnamed protein product [Nyctereutes procyonoides]